MSVCNEGICHYLAVCMKAEPTLLCTVYREKESKVFFYSFYVVKRYISYLCVFYLFYNNIFMKTFTDAESEEGSIKMFAPIIVEEAVFVRTNFQWAWKKICFRKNCQSGSVQKRKKKTIPQITASYKTLTLLLRRNCSGLKTQLSFKNLLVSFIVICIWSARNTVLSMCITHWPSKCVVISVEFQRQRWNVLLKERW